MVFREPTDPEAAVIADAMIRAGRVGDSLYACLLAATDRLYAPLPVTRAFAFDALGTLVHIGRKLLPFERLIRKPRGQAEALPSPMVQPVSLADYAAALRLPHPAAKLTMLDEELVTIALTRHTGYSAPGPRAIYENRRRFQLGSALCSLAQRPSR